MTAPVPIMRVTGTLDPFFETGTEGVIWSLVVAGMPGYDGLFSLHDGDELVIYNATGQAQWRGQVKLEYERRWRPYPTNPKHGQQEVLGFWVHGFQATLDPEVWAKAFFDRAPAVLWRPLPEPSLMGREGFLMSEGQRLLAADPAAALRALTQMDPEGAKRLPNALYHGWRYLCEQMGWPMPTLTTVPEELAWTWRRLLALHQADRLLWAPGHEEDRWAPLKARWPTLDAFTEDEVAQWAQARLPLDDDLPLF